GVVQLAGSDDPDVKLYMTADADKVEVLRGAHPTPNVKVTAPTQIFLSMFRGKFAFFDPNALDRLTIDGDAALLLPLFGYVSDSNQKLEPFQLAADIRRGAPALTSVPRLECPPESVLREALANYQPLLITGAIDRWPWMAKELTPDLLVQRFGDLQ